MNIVVHSGLFLSEGLQDLGHHVFAVHLRENTDINEQIAAVCPNADMVVMELFGHVPVPLNFHECAYPTVAYCIDSPINEFYLADLLHLFDYVFVDQRSSVARLKEQGINAAWLPLCLPRELFRQPAPQKYGITFAGNVGEHRKKRSGLLHFLELHYPVHFIKDLSLAATQDVLAQSSIVLNENLFSGLTLRILQGMASGSLVLTELGADGVADFFTDREHLVCYEPYTLLEILKDIESRPEVYAKIAMAGQQVCRAHHTSTTRAGEMLAALEACSGNKTRDQRRQKYYMASAVYTISLRFGGDYSRAVQLFQELSQGQDNVAAWSAFALGNMCARRGQLETAFSLYRDSLKKGFLLYPCLKLCLLLLHKGDAEGALHMLESCLKHAPGMQQALQADMEKIQSLPDAAPHILACISKIYFYQDKKIHVGFFKPWKDIVPDTALEIAMLAWEQQPSAALLDIMLACCPQQGSFTGELLPTMQQAAKKGVLTQEQCQKAYAFAVAYYDFDLQQEFRDYMSASEGAQTTS